MKEDARTFAVMPHVTADDVRKVLYENAATVFQLDLDALQPVFEQVAFDIEYDVLT